MRLRIATILVGHERSAYLEALAKIEAILEASVPNAIRTTVIVDNARPRCEFERLSPTTVIVGGDNSLREFSAWDRGFAYLDRTRENPDLIHLATSAFDSLYTGYLDSFNEKVLLAARSARAVVGHVDYYDEPIEILGRTSQHWIRTSFFFLPLEAAHALRSVVSYEHPADIFTDDPSQPFRSDAAISISYQNYILAWLTGEGTGQGVVWHSRFDLNEETMPLFRTKALAILNEHLLSIRLRECGYPVADVLWLAERLAEEPPEKIDWRRPWNEQIAERST